jgi:hypothetical protein
MEFNLNTEQKIRAINETKTSMLNELFGHLLRIGIDPDEFDPTTWVLLESATGDETRIDSLLTNIARADAKIASLS